MALIVQKFGGTSVADIERLKHVALIIKNSIQRGNSPVAVVSAMAGVTNQLVSYTQGVIGSEPEPQSLAEYDTILAAGEQVTSGLLALALQNEGIPSRSFLAWQLPILTDHNFSNAKPLLMETTAVLDCIEKGVVPVIAGFQGINNHRLTTLGRGGSDATAVFVAATLKAEFCDIYTDVDGVYTADPRIVSNAKKIKKISVKEMLELAQHGAKVLQTRSVELAKEYNVRLRVLSSFGSFDDDGTEVILSDDFQEKRIISICGIAHTYNDARFHLMNVTNSFNFIKNFLTECEKKGIYLDVVIHSVDWEGKSNLHFTVAKADVIPVKKVMNECHGLLNFSDIHVDTQIAKISLIGSNFNQCPEMITEMSNTLLSNGIKTAIMSSTPTKMSLIVPEPQAAQTIRILHDTFI
jgi:aspartate kinase